LVKKNPPILAGDFLKSFLMLHQDLLILSPQGLVKNNTKSKIVLLSSLLGSKKGNFSAITKKTKNKSNAAG
jgi:hypothetical protein